jgi:hypothetical protein
MPSYETMTTRTEFNHILQNVVFMVNLVMHVSQFVRPFTSLTETLPWILIKSHSLTFKTDSWLLPFLIPLVWFYIRTITLKANMLSSYWMNIPSIIPIFVYSAPISPADRTSSIHAIINKSEYLTNVTK